MLAAAGSGTRGADAFDCWWQAGQRFEPGLDAAARERRYRHWQCACERARDWAHPTDGAQ
jgi:glycerol kinase